MGCDLEKGRERFRADSLLRSTVSLSRRMRRGRRERGQRVGSRRHHMVIEDQSFGVVGVCGVDVELSVDCSAETDA